MAYKINLHITQKCNYDCKYCFAHFEDCHDFSVAEWKKIIDNIKASGLIDAINFAGGEPVLYKGFSELIDYAHGLGFRLSIITNGSLMLNERLMPPAYFKKFEMLGISVDSVDPRVLALLGACTKSHEVLTRERLTKLISTARRENPSIRVKLNTVVTNLNAGEDLNDIGRELSIDRWKILRMKEFSHDGRSNSFLLTDDASYKGFVDRNKGLSRDVVPENDLTRTYIMVDNRGRLLDDNGDTYTVVGDLLAEDFADVFARFHLDEAAYASRYAA